MNKKLSTLGLLVTVALSMGFISTHAEATQTEVVYKPNPPPMTITLPVMHRGYVDGPFGQVHFQDAGKGRPLVMFHQAPMSSRQFESVFKYLIDQGIRPIAIDLPGFGMSDTTAFVPTIEDYAKIFVPVIDALGLDVVDVLGHHTGALVATEVGLQFPKRVRKLVLGGPFPVDEAERKEFLKFVQGAEIDFEYLADGSHLAKSFEVRYNMYNDTSDVPPSPKLITRYAVEKFVGYGPFWYGHHAAFTYDHKQTIPKISHPTLILTNTGDQIFDKAQLTKQMRPDFEMVVLQGGGVDIVDQQPQAWAEAVVKYLKD